MFTSVRSYGFRILAAFGFMAALCLPAIGKPEDAARKPVMVVLDIFPFSWREDGQDKGLFVDIARQVRQRSGVDYDIIFQPFGRNIQSLATGKADYSIFHSYPDNDFGYETVGIVSCARLIVVPMANRGITTIDDLNGKSVIFPPGGYFDRHFARHMDIKAVPVAAGESILELASRGRADAFTATDQLIESYQLKISDRYSMPEEFWPKLGKPVELVEANLAFVVSDKSPFRGETGKIAAAISEMQRSGELLRLAKKYSSTVQTGCYSVTAK
ncbi:substrate-binding periplasmic protein [Emcibacter sp.]|uniref:substrate-binding periplasmic protein n=1 Tax=Emcibacter sp. TaxID=1979954 RepID=UPI002AA813EF|nr:transporter substrate-binding domain-containing protein [Emcibacter sp.]